MQLIRKILFLENIYTSRTTTGLLYDFAFCLLIAVVAISSFGKYRSLLVATAIVCFVILLRSWIREWIIAQRLRRGTYEPFFDDFQTQVTDSAIDDELDKLDTLSKLQVGNGWRMYDAFFNFYRSTRGGKYLNKRMIYTVFETKLVRNTPHLIFDAHNAKRRQFQAQYVNSQKLSFEGDFDNYFDVYAPNYYQIDTLSFMTPEVLQAMLTARKYDMELKNNSLLLYAPLLDAKEQGRLQEAGLYVAQHLNDNLGRYRDSYLPTDESKHNVLPFATQLLKSPRRYIPRLALSIGAIGLIALFARYYVHDMHFILNQYTVIASVVAIEASYKIIRTVIQNKRFVKSMRMQLSYASTHRTKPRGPTLTFRPK